MSNRWVTVDGPYACTTEQDHNDVTELHMVESIRCYYRRRMLRSGPFVPFTIIGGCATDEGYANASIEIR
jgi:hypothetical protein